MCARSGVCAVGAAKCPGFSPQRGNRDKHVLHCSRNRRHFQSIVPSSQSKHPTLWSFDCVFFFFFHSSSLLGISKRAYKCRFDVSFQLVLGDYVLRPRCPFLVYWEKIFITRKKTREEKKKASFSSCASAEPGGSYELG